MRDLIFNFKIDKLKRTVFIEKEYAYEKSLVWDTFTKQELLDQWWAPKPWESKSKYMNFEKGGKRFYAMVSPEGDEHWSIQNYILINPQNNFKFYNAFADKDENAVLPGSEWELTFTENDGITKVGIHIYNESAERMEQQLEMGFQGGITMTLNNLESLLKSLSSK